MIKSLTLKKSIILIILTLALLPQTVWAVGISVKPSRLKTQAPINQLTSLSLQVKNPSDSVCLYDVYLDEFSDWIKPNPSSFTLEAGETKKVTLQIKPQTPQTAGTIISVVTRPLSNRKFAANSGIKIPLEINVLTPQKPKKSPLTSTHLIFLLDLILTLILLTLLIPKFLNKKKNKSLYPLKINLLEHY